MVEEFFEVKIRIVEQDVLNKLVEIRLGDGEAGADILEGGALIEELAQNGFDAAAVSGEVETGEFDMMGGKLVFALILLQVDVPRFDRNTGGINLITHEPTQLGAEGIDVAGGRTFISGPLLGLLDGG